MPRATENRGNRQQLRQLGHTCDAKKPNAIRVMEGASGPLPVDRWLININFAPFSISYCQLAVVSPPHFRRLQINGFPFSWDKHGRGLLCSSSELTTGTLQNTAPGVDRPGTWDLPKVLGGTEAQKSPQVPRFPRSRGKWGCSRVPGPLFQPATNSISLPG